MLNEDNDPIRDDSWFAGETAAAMRDFARTVTEAPPLRLAAGFSPARTRRRMRGARRWRTWTWLAPATAAAMVVALAVALVISRNLTSTGAVPANGPSASGPATAGPGGVPRYYVAVQEGGSGSAGKATAAWATHLVVGDSFTGAELTSIAPPAGVVFLDVTAAGDDRTFVVAGWDGAGASATVRFFEIRLAPGTGHPVVMTSMPIESQPAGKAASANRIAATLPVALSSSGTELAVAETAGTGGIAVKVFSVATGKLLHDWTTTDPPLVLDSLADPPALTWIDGDRALALATLGTPTSLNTIYGARQTVRRLNVPGRAGSDLVADGTVQWEVPDGADNTCGYRFNWPPVISADGKTFTCTTGTSFVTYPLTAGPKGAGQGRVDLSLGSGYLVHTVLWTSASGDTTIAEWGAASSIAGQPKRDGGVQIGVISHGTSTPLRISLHFLVYAGGIAW